MTKNCEFCDLAYKKVKFPGTFWEDKKHIAFLSGRPNTEGFAVVITKKHFGSNVLAMPDKELQELVLASKKVSKILMKYFKDVGRVGLIMEGTGIDHAHIKLFPMHGTAQLKSAWKQYKSKTRKFFKKYEGYIASNIGPKVDSKIIRKHAIQLKKISKN
ncbi:HIT family protein [Candidatus Woesearchaeota archaeon]|nr:HIT family protein [Candidatus Woesearchaeota archaeon]